MTPHTLHQSLHTTHSLHHLDDPAQVEVMRHLLARKPALRRYYADAYQRYADCLQHCPLDGIALELGSGGGFAKDVLPHLVTSDVLPCAGVDQTIDATQLPFGDQQLRFIGMLNVFHHIPDVQAFLREAARCLKPGGRLLIIDQYLGWLSTPILKYVHHEPFQPHQEQWQFQSTGPLSGANGALAWMVFVRDQQYFRQQFPQLKLERYQPHTPLLYWLAGGLKTWSLVPRCAVSWVVKLDGWLGRCLPRLNSFVDIELVRE